MKAGTDMKDGFNLTWTRHYLRRNPFKYVQGFFSPHVLLERQDFK